MLRDHTIASDVRLGPTGELYQLGFALMDKASDAGSKTKEVRAKDTLAYRDGLMIALLAADLAGDDRQSVSRLMRRLRDEAEGARLQGVAWQSVLDSLRPITAEIWQRLPLQEQRRFLRHARRWWDVHRHRTAPGIAQQLRGLVDQGYLRVEAARVVAREPIGRHIRVSYRRRGCKSETHIHAQASLMPLMLRPQQTCPQESIGAKPCEAGSPSARDRRQ
jgi:hypothetical protein